MILLFATALVLPLVIVFSGLALDLTVLGTRDKLPGWRGAQQGFNQRAPQNLTMMRPTTKGPPSTSIRFSLRSL
jgi:hypothetical protein